MLLTNKYKAAISVTLFAVAIFFSSYKLTESPPTWMDEGIIIQTARSASSIGYPALPIAPGVFASAGVVTTSYPVTMPIAAMFSIFGAGLLQARLVMLIYLLLITMSAFILLKRFISPERYLLPFTLFVSFAPLYGQGKNVLGEVPGMFFFLVFMASIYQIETIKRRSIWLYLVAGVSAGLLFVTKPIFVLVIPAVLIAYVFHRYLQKPSDGPLFDHRSLIWSAAAFALPIVIWLVSQFSGESISFILSVYANPHKVSIVTTVLSDIRLFFSDFQPMYFLILMVIWLISYLIRWRGGKHISFAESISLFFTLLAFAAFFRTPGYYRYFFPAQMLAILYLYPSLRLLASKALPSSEKRASTIAILGMTALILFQAYGLLFTSWTAKSYASTRTREMQESFSNLTSRNIFLYQVPEVATFLPESSFYQFFYAAPQLPIGESSLKALYSGVPDTIIVNPKDFADNPGIFSKYKEARKAAGRYLILERR